MSIFQNYSTFSYEYISSFTGDPRYANDNSLKIPTKYALTMHSMQSNEYLEHTNNQGSKLPDGEQRYVKKR